MSETAPRMVIAALWYAARGWPVFPCHTPKPPDGCSCGGCAHPGKHPRTLHGVKDATTDEATIRKWWTMWPDANVAVATGSVSGLVVLDNDTYHGGDESLAALEEEYGPLPATSRQQTGGGGWQYLFALHQGEEVHNSTGMLGPGLDIRGEGGYVIVPPSLHASGKRYTWVDGARPDQQAPALFPTWLALPVAHRHDTPEVSGVFREGERNNRLFKAGCALRHHGVGEAGIARALASVNESECEPPLGEEEVRQIAHQCAGYPLGKRRAEEMRDDEDLEGDEPDKPPSKRLLTDMTNARLLVEQRGDDMRYCAVWQSWVIWDGARWQQDIGGLQVLAWAQDVQQKLEASLPDLPAIARETMAKHAKRSGMLAGLRAMGHCAAATPELRVTPDTFNTAPWLLNCLNGTLELATGRLYAPRREDYLMQQTRVAYDPDARCPRWMAFLEEILQGDAALIAFVQRALGYALTGVTTEQCLFVCWGTGANGKSTLLNTVHWLLGDYATKASAALFVDGKDSHFAERAKLLGCRFVSLPESEEHAPVRVGFVKEATGGEPLLVRRLYENPWELTPTFTFFFGTNHKPKMPGDDPAVWRRMRLIPFTVTIPPERQDQTLPEALREEAPGILAWMVRGCLAWQARGLEPPAAVAKATAEYQGEMDVLAHFLEECCVRHEQATCRASAIYAAYQEWCRRTGEREWSQRVFGEHLGQREGIQRVRNNGMVYRGVGLPAPQEEVRR